MTICCRGVRGATTVAANTEAAILAATHELLTELVAANEIAVDELGSVIFTTTPDLDAVFPARAARQLGWHAVALLCTHEIETPRALARCIRVLLHWNTPKPPSQIRHVYLHGARVLRPDWLPVLASELVPSASPPCGSPVSDPQGIK